MTTATYRFPSADPQSIRHGPFAIPWDGKCAVCGIKFRQGKHGRPRILCGKQSCARTRHAQLKRSYSEPRWTEEDLQEAVRLWRGCYCGSNARPYRFQWEFAPLPRCQLCWKAPITD